MIQEELRGDKRMYEEVVEEGRDPRVPRSQCPKAQGSHGPSYLKVTFKYELDSKEGLSCFLPLKTKLDKKHLADHLAYSRVQNYLGTIKSPH